MDTLTTCSTFSAAPCCRDCGSVSLSESRERTLGEARGVLGLTLLGIGVAALVGVAAAWMLVTQGRPGAGRLWLPILLYGMACPCFLIPGLQIVRTARVWVLSCSTCGTEVSRTADR